MKLSLASICEGRRSLVSKKALVCAERCSGRQENICRVCSWLERLAHTSEGNGAWWGVRFDMIHMVCAGNF